MSGTTYTWDGSDADWDSSSDWTPNGIPNGITNQATINAGTVTIPAAGSYDLDALTIDGVAAEVLLAGTLDLSNSVDDAITIDSGTLAIEQGGTILGAPTVTLGGGTLDVSGSAPAVVTIGALDGSGTVVLGNAVLTVGTSNSNSSFSGTIVTGTTQQGGLIDKIGTGALTLDNVVMNPGSGSSGLYVAAGSLVENTGSSNLFYAAIGEGTNDTASATLSGGTLTIGTGNAGSGAALQIGDFGGAGSFSQTGGLLSLAGSLNIGNQGGSGTYAVSGGTLALGGGFAILGRNTTNHAASSGTLEISGTGLIDASSSEEILLGDNTINASTNPATSGQGSGTIVQTGGTLEVDAGAALYLSAVGNGAYALNGGTLAIGGASLFNNYNGGAGISAFALGGGTIEVIGSSLTTDANATLTAASTSAINLNGFNAAFSGTIAGAGNLAITGTGSAGFTHLNTTGAVTLAGGTLDVSGSASGAAGVGGLDGSGTVVLGNAVLSVGTGNADSSFSGTIITGTAQRGGLIDKIGTGALTLDNVVMNPGSGSSGLYVAAGSLVENTGSSSLFYSGIGEGVGANASATLSGGTLTIGTGDASSGAALQIGDFGGAGSFNQTGGLLSLAGSLNIGNQGGSGTYAVSGGTLALGGGFAILGRNTGSHAASSGTLEISGTGLIDASSSEEILLGDNTATTGGAGEGSGTIVQTGGTLEVDAGAALYLSAVGNGAYALNGGTLAIGGASLFNNYNGGAGTSAFTFGGGTIEVIGSSLTTDANATLTAASTSAINLNGFNAAFSGTVAGAGNLAITGTGSAGFTHLNTTGAVTLAGGTLDVSGSASGAAGIGALDGLGTVVLGNAVLSVGTGNADSSFSGTIVTGTTQQGGLIDKIGTGALTLDNVVMNPGTGGSGLYVAAGSLVENTGSSSLFYAAIGEGTNNTASAALSGGTLTIGNGNASSGAALQIGDFGGAGSFSETAGLLSLAGSLNIGNQGGSGSYAISGGTLALGGGFAILGRNTTNHAASSGTLEISGTGLVDASSSEEILLGDNTTNASTNPVTSGQGSGTIVQTGGTLEVDAGAALYLSAVGNGAYALNGGTLAIGGASLFNNYNGGAGTSAFALGGGTIEVIGSSLTTDANASLTAGSASTLNLNGFNAAFSGTIAGAGNLEIIGVGTASFNQLTATGTVDFDGGTLALTGAITSGLDVSFSPDNQERLNLTDAAQFSGTLSGFVPGDVIDLGVFADDTSTFVSDRLIVSSDGAQVADLQFIGAYADGSISVQDIGGRAEVVACFRVGTRIRTPDGDVAIEALAVGDLVLTASGQARPVRWLGHRAVDIAAQPDPSMTWPVIVREGAFAPGLPARDLALSPEHKVAHQGVLIPIYLLENGRTILQRRCDAIEYWHVELDTHDVVLAEGLPAETYLDTGNRAAFVEGGAFMMLHPDFRTHGNADTCLPLVLDGPLLTAAKASLLANAETLGHTLTDADEVHILADGRRVEPTQIGETRVAFLLPAGCSDISIRSRVFVPAHISAEMTDRRSLGVYLERLQIDGEEFALQDEGACADGWHRYEEHAGRRGRRWTNGTTPLPPNTRLIVLDFAGRGTYWSRRTGNVMTLFG